MRLVDIYCDDGTRLIPAALDCIQIGSVTLRRTPIVKSFTMADGSIRAYPAALDTAETALQLECTEEQAKSIGSIIHYGEAVIAGAKWLAAVPYGVSANPAGKGLRVQIAGGVQLEEKYAESGIYAVQIPLRLMQRTTGSGYYAEEVPVVGFSSLTIGGTAEHPARWVYSRGGRYVRKNPIFLSSEAAEITYSFTLPDGIPEYEGAAVLYRDGIPVAIANVPGTSGTITAPLMRGANGFRLTMYGNQYAKPLQFQFLIYRNGVSL